MILLRDYRPRTKEAYLHAAQQLVDRFGRAPELLCEEDLRAPFLYLREQRRLAPATIHLALHGLRFFCRHTLG